MALVFISYRREDSAGYAGRLHESLERRLGHDQVFRDVDTLEPGQDFVEAIHSRVRECHAFIALIGREWLDARDASGRRRLDQESDYVRLETLGAMSRPQLLVVPVLVEGVTMPASDDLPEPLRPLARRHAVSLHDETWDADVDRLVAAITKSHIVQESDAANPTPSTSRNLFVLIILAAILVATVLLTRTKDTAPDATKDRVDTPASPGVAYAVEIPRMAEIAHNQLTYTLISASVTPGANNNALRLRIRVSNDDRYDANFWDSSFRLIVNDSVLPPTSGLNKVVPGHSIDQGIVTFDAPLHASKASLRVEYQGQAGDIPLNLSPSNRPAEDEKADAGDVLSKAILTTVLNEPKGLLLEQHLTCTLTRVTTRRFANKLRVMISARVRNSNSYPEHSGVLLLRLQTSNELTAPVQAPNEVLQPATDQSVDYAFDLPPSVTRAVLRASVRDTMAELPLDLR